MSRFTAIASRRARGLLAAALTLVVALTPSLVDAAIVPAGFTDSTIATGLASPTAMELAPDGRIFVAEQGGNLRVIKNGALLATPFLTVSVDPTGERGLIGVTLDPILRPTGSCTSTTRPWLRRSQPGQPVHRERRQPGRRGAHGDDPRRSRQPVDRDQPQRRRASVRRRRQALRGRRRERQRSERADARQSAGQAAALQRQRHHPERQTRSTTPPRARIARSGRPACAIPTRSRSSPAPAG
jgi:hypothetical protein